jgi:DNA-binding LacI/PurR family transcriptional regulator
VAATAGVSKSTVSNVVRGSQHVSAATRGRVQDAIDDLGYTPNAIARQFVQRRTTTLGILVGDLRNPYHAQLSRVVERAAFARGYTTMFCNIAVEDELAIAGVEALLEHRVAGVVFIALNAHESRLDEVLQQCGVPTVFLGSTESWGDSVSPHDHHGGELATRHLLDLGHRRIAFLRTPMVQRSAGRQRHRAYQATMRLAGLPALPPYGWTPGAPTVAIGRRRLGLRDAFAGDGAPTAVFASNDAGAIALIDGCERSGVRIPDDLSIVGFDDIGVSGLRRIALTTIAQSLDVAAARAVALVMERIDSPRLSDRHEIVEVELRVRGSTAPVAARPSGRRVAAARPGVAP